MGWWRIMVFLDWILIIILAVLDVNWQETIILLNLNCILQDNIVQDMVFIVNFANL